jgi:hypothetical protein
MTITDLPPRVHLSRDLAKAAITLSDAEARYLVDTYYQIQEGRKRSGNQIGAMDIEPHDILKWVHGNHEDLEHQIKRALDHYSQSKPIGEWMHSIYGIGPVIAAGLLAHIDIDKAPTAGHIWNFAGLNPSTKWNKGEKRPWNASLKTLTWKIGQSFMKFSGQDDCFYGKIYLERKAYEVARNDSGGNAATAKDILATKKINKSTDQFKHLTADKLPPAQIDARARRYAVKMFLSHLQTVWWYLEHGVLPPKPFAISILGHAHLVEPPNAETIPGLLEAMRSWGK